MKTIQLHRVTLVVLVLFVSMVALGQEEYKSYEGQLNDADTKKALSLASITVKGTNISTITNAEGDFLLKVPAEISDAMVVFSYLGYETKNMPLKDLKPKGNKIQLNISITALSEVSIDAPQNPRRLVEEVLETKGQKYVSDPTLMTAFYRETIKKRKRNVSLSEAVVNIYKAPYSTLKNDAIKLYKARKSTDYSKLDTVALKLQGGPFNALYVDIMKYPEYIFTEESLDNYNFTFSNSTYINNRLIYVIAFNQLDEIINPLYQGKLYIDAKSKTLTSAVYELNITDRDLAAQLFVRKKPNNVQVWPTEVAYRVDYRNSDNKWYYSYSNVLMEFKVNWKNKLFNSVYSMAAEMAVTDWEVNKDEKSPKFRDRLKKSIILNDEAVGFSDPEFWGEYNIIEPEKSIESAIKKIQRQLKKSTPSNGTAMP
ncbi:carboxypeptidase-like regulatory domain-containing protein [Croceitalea dokdonensis]|nr:carboxypeptidase-like regulatory domain-containing protein [Croceitalea dokdonensis]